MTATIQRPRGSLKDRVRVSLTVESESWDRLGVMAAAAGTSRSGIMQWLVDHAETDEQGHLIGWRDEELPMTG